MSTAYALPTDLVGALYDLALDPMLFEQFADAWDKFAQAAHTQNDDDLSDSMQQHFERAFMLLEKIGRSSENKKPLEQLVEEREGPCLGISRIGKVLSFNEAAKQSLGETLLSKNFLDAVHAKSKTSLREAIAQVSESDSGIPVLVLLDNNLPALLMLTKSANDEQVLVDITGAVWSERVSEFLKKTHELTNAEVEVAKLLYQGLSLQEIAGERHRSKETIRKHLGSLFAKTDCRTQAHLMRLITGINFARDVDSRPRWFSDRCEPKNFVLSDGRTLCYYDYGKSSEPAIVVMHPTLRTPELPHGIEKKIRSKGHRIIGVCRAGYGDSSAAPTKRSVIDGGVDDLSELLKSLSIDKFAMLGLMGGSVHCYQTAMRFGERVTRIINVSGTVPVVSEEQFDNMPPSTRAIAHTARNLPELFPLLVRSAVALIDSGETDKFINALYRNSPIDLDYLEQSDAREWVTRGCEFAVHQGHATYVNELTEITSIKFEFNQLLKSPVTMIHAEHDGMISTESVRSMADQHPLISMSVIKDAGHLMLHMKPDEVATEILKALEQA